MGTVITEINDEITEDPADFDLTTVEDLPRGKARELSGESTDLKEQRPEEM